jgi:hypothetical protein
MGFLKTFLLATAIAFLLCTSVSYAQFKTYTNLLQNSNSLFVANAGQVVDQDGKPQSDIRYIYSVPGFKLILKKNSFSYDFTSAQK